MTSELTMEGLFSYFDPKTVLEIIRQKLPQQNISAEDYHRCLDACDSQSFHQRDVYTKNIIPINALLSLPTLQQASITDVLSYLDILAVKDAYLHCYGENFLIFETNFLKARDERIIDFSPPSLNLDPVTEKLLITQLQAALSPMMVHFYEELRKQDFLLQEIAADLSLQAKEAQKYILAVQKYNAEYKDNALKLLFSIIRVGLNAVNANEVVNLGATLTKVASSILGDADILTAIVSGVQDRMSNTCVEVLAEAEKQLLSATTPDAIARCWLSYRRQINTSSNELIRDIYSSNFFKCVIRETLAQGKGLTQEALLINSTEKAQDYLSKILSGLTSQVAKIQRMGKAIQSHEGSEEVKNYFQKIFLIRYTTAQINSKRYFERWISKGVGRQLAAHFPASVSQKGWSFKELCRKRPNATVRLGFFYNSRQDLRKLNEELKGLPHKLNDELVGVLAQLEPQNCSEVLDTLSIDSANHGVYFFPRSRRSIFSSPTPSLERSFEMVKPIEKKQGNVTLTSMRLLEVN